MVSANISMPKLNMARMRILALKIVSTSYSSGLLIAYDMNLWTPFAIEPWMNPNMVINPATTL